MPRNVSLACRYSESALPQVYPIFDGLYLSDDGEQLWVKRTDGTDGSVFDVFDRRGALQAAVFSEASLTAALAPVIVGDRIWAVVFRRTRRTLRCPFSGREVT